MYFNVQQFFLSALKGMVHSAIIFFITFLSYQESGVLSAEEGYNTNLWTSSVCTFTALIVTVNLNLMLRMKYMTKLHAIGFIVFSFSAYFTFMWLTNYTALAWTESAVLQAHRSLIFYLIIACTVGICLSTDLFHESYKVLIQTSPHSFLRQLISSKQSIESPTNHQTFVDLSNDVHIKLKAKQSKSRQLTNIRAE